MYNRLQTAQLRPGYVTLSAAALAARLGMSRRQAERLIAATAAAQADPTALRVVRLPVRIGSGAKRDALHILWPVH
jgi:predicted DNA-binding transcriptional regulator YafY